MVPPLLVWAAALSIDDGGRGLEHLDAAASLAGSVAGGVHVDEETTALLRGVREASLELDLATLHAMLPRGDAGRRFARVAGGPAPGAYRVGQVDALEQDLALGALTAELAMVGGDRGELGRAWVLTATGGLGTGPIGPGDATRLAERVLVAVEAAARDGSVVDALRRELPATLALVDQVVAVRSLAGIRDGDLVVDLDAALTGDPLRRGGRPALAAWVDGLDDLVTVRLRVTDPQGLTYATASYDSADGALTARLRARDGALVPLDGGAPLDLGAPALDPVVELDVEVRDQGFLVAVSDLGVPIAWRSDGRRAHAHLTFPAAPAVTITGTNDVSAILAAVADGALGLRQAADGVFEALVDGDSGATLAWAEGEGIAAEAHGSVLDNGLVRYGARVVGRHLVPTDAAVAEASRLVSDLAAALEADYRASRPRLGAP